MLYLTNIKYDTDPIGLSYVCITFIQKRIRISVTFLSEKFKIDEIMEEWRSDAYGCFWLFNLTKYY